MASPASLSHTIWMAMPSPPKPMNSLSLSLPLSLSSKFRANASRFLSSHLRVFSASSSINLGDSIPCRPASRSSGVRDRVRVRVRLGVKASAVELKENWLASLSCPLPRGTYGGLNGDQEDSDSANAASDWVIGIDPDTYGAFAVLKGNGPDCSAQVI